MNLAPAFNGLALLAAAAAYRSAARRQGLATEGMFWISMSGLFWGLAGASLFHVLLVEWPQGKLLGGRSLYGGLVGGWLGVTWMKRRLHIVRPTGDLFALALAAGESVGRLGCYYGGCCYGRVSTLPWACYQHEAWRHPTQLYQALGAALGYLLLRLLQSRVREGSLLGWYLLLFCPFRFVIEFFREGKAMGGLTMAQWVAIGLFCWGFRQVFPGQKPIH